MANNRHRSSPAGLSPSRQADSRRSWSLRPRVDDLYDDYSPYDTLDTSSWETETPQERRFPRMHQRSDQYTRSARRSNRRSTPGLSPVWSPQPTSVYHGESPALDLNFDVRSTYDSPMAQGLDSYPDSFDDSRFPSEARAPIAISAGTSPVDQPFADYDWERRFATHDSNSPIVPPVNTQPLPHVSLRSAQSFADLRSFPLSPQAHSPSSPASVAGFLGGLGGAPARHGSRHTESQPSSPQSRPGSSNGSDLEDAPGYGETPRSYGQRDAPTDADTPFTPRRRRAQYSTELVDSMNQKSHAPAENAAFGTAESMNLEDDLMRTTDWQYELLLCRSVTNDTLKLGPTSSASQKRDRKSIQVDSSQKKGSPSAPDDQSTIRQPDHGMNDTSQLSHFIESRRRPLIECYDATVLLKGNIRLSGGGGFTVLCNEQSRPSTISISILEGDFISAFQSKIVSLLDATQDLVKNDTSELQVPPDASRLAGELDTECQAFWGRFTNAGLAMPSWSPHLNHFQEDLVDAISFSALSIRAKVWLFTLQMIDMMVLCHNSSHIIDFKAHFGWDPQVDDWYPHTPSLALREKRPVFRRRPLACLGGMLDYTPVWVLQAAHDPTEGNCHVSCTAMEIAAAWGDVYGVQGNGSDGFESFRIPLGFVLRCDPSEAECSKLVGEERFCHWVPEMAYLAREPEERALSQNTDPLKALDRMLIGMEPLPSMQLKPCNHNQIGVDDAFFKDSVERDLGTRPSRTWWDPTFQLAGGFHITATLIGKRQREQITQKQALIDRWALDDNWGSPRDLESMWGVMVSRCTLNAKRVRIRDLLKTPTMRFEIDDCRWTVPGLKKCFLDAVMSPDETAIMALWDLRSGDARQELRRIILSLLRTLAQSGICRKENNSSDTDRFDILWRPDAESRMKVATINAGNHPWVTFLRDRHYSSCMAVMVEEEIRLSGRFSHGRHSYRSQKPSALETVVKISHPPTQLRWAYYFLHSRGTIEHPPWPVHRNWAYALKVDTTATGLALELKSGKLRIERALGDWYLVTRWKESKARQAAQSLGFNMEEKKDVCEELEKFDRAQLRPLPVHIIGDAGWYEERRRVVEGALGPSA